MCDEFIIGGAPTRSHASARGEHDSFLWRRVWLTRSLSGHRIWGSGSSAAGAPSCRGGVTPRSLEVCV